MRKDCSNKTNVKLTKNISSSVAKNVVAILDILRQVGIPFEGLTSLRLQRMAQACLAIGRVTQSLKDVKSVKDGVFLRTREILQFENEHYNECIFQ